jgi:ornithine carbamoyltransferase
MIIKACARQRRSLVFTLCEDRLPHAPKPMNPSLRQAGLHDFANLSAHDVAAVLTDAQGLQRAALHGAAQPLLRGKNLGLLCESQDAEDSDAALFRRAAVELGARVAQVRPSLLEHSAVHELQHTARMLGRLYDAVECQGMPAELVQRLRVHTDVPVYHGLASPHHPTARIAELLDAAIPMAERRCFVLKAVLLGTMG